MADASADISLSPDNELNVEWTDTLFTNIKDDLPKICKYEGQLPQGLKLYSQQPVLLYRWYHKRKGEVRTIYRDTTGPYYEVGQTLQIPEDFEGWFELVPPDFGRVKYYESIEEVSKTMPMKFFTRTNLTGICVGNSGESEQTYVQRKIPAGTVLKVESTFKAKWRTCAETGVLKKKQKEWTSREIQYLKCIDNKEQEILIPFTAKGKFHPVYQNGSSDSKCLFRMKDILTNLTLPVKVRIIYGKPPVVPCIFTGMLVIKRRITEDVFVGSTITFKRHALFELPAYNDVKIFMAKSEEQFVDMKTYKDAKQLCQKYSDSYSSLIKLSPKLDTDHQMIQHIPTEKTKQRHESLKTLDLITNISLTDDEPRSQFMESSSDDTVSEQSLTLGTLVELKEFSNRTSMMC
ncbi:uncharacterized protein LOC127735071 [Mytilus californianus]|uniref:uncharacterized protein LOC127735071 n=1 Tax=Mytilus californianus TaxID=6549 RepID=UPI0022457658|nr:uncharacterized protein LOC127735071 [Mytilus californianus]